MSLWMTREYKDLQPEGRRQECSEIEKSFRGCCRNLVHGFSTQILDSSSSLE